MKVLVTGGAGYIGSVAADELLKAGHKVTVYDSLVQGHRAAVPEPADFVSGDIMDRAALDQLMAGGGFDAVMHFAAFTEAGASMREPSRFFRNNVCGSLNLIEAAVNHSVPRFIFSSSASVYAGKDTPLQEEDTLGPASVYGQTKLMIEQMLGWYHQIHGLRYAALRYFNAAGATRERGEVHDPETHLIPNILMVALEQRERISIFGDDYPTPDGTCVRDYVHILDLAAAHILALEGLDDRGAMVYNLGNGSGYSNLQVLEAARKVTEHPIPADLTPRRPGDAPSLVADASRIRSDLGWEPRFPDLDEIVASAWAWHNARPSGYES